MIWALGMLQWGTRKNNRHILIASESNFHFIFRTLFFFLDYDSWQESQMWLCGWHVVVFYIPSSISQLCVALSSSRPLSRSLLLWVAKTCRLFFAASPVHLKKGLWEQRRRKWTVQTRNRPSCNVFWGAVEDACRQRLLSCLSNEYWKSVSASWKGKSFIRIGLDTHAISGARAFISLDFQLIGLLWCYYK